MWSRQRIGFQSLEFGCAVFDKRLEICRPLLRRRQTAGNLLVVAGVEPDARGYRNQRAHEVGRHRRPADREAVGRGASGKRQDLVKRSRHRQTMSLQKIGTPGRRLRRGIDRQSPDAAVVGIGPPRGADLILVEHWRSSASRNAVKVEQPVFAAGIADKGMIVDHQIVSVGEGAKIALPEAVEVAAVPADLPAPVSGDRVRRSPRADPSNVCGPRQSL